MAEILLGIPLESWRVLCEMAPYLLFGFVVAGILSVVISPETVERHLGGKGMMPIFKAALFGIPLPLCSCGVIPVGASLRRHGASRGATSAFLLSTPQTGVDSVLVTLGLLGPVYAVFRPVAALLTGVVGGLGVEAFGGKNGQDDAPPPCEDACCSGGAKESKVAAVARYALVTLPRDIGKPLLVGLVAVGLISAFVPDDYFAGMLGSGLGAMVVMMLLGMPLYVCATASVPVAAALIAKGVSPGAALVFLMTGPATNAAAIATIWKVLGRRTAVVYLVTVAVTALVAGVALDAVYTTSGAVATPHGHWMMPEFVKVGSAVLLLAVLGAAFVRPAHSRESDTPAPAGLDTATLAVTGMTCSHCAQSVRRALVECAGIESAEVDLDKGEAAVWGRAFETDALVTAVESLGFGVRRA